jgi:hypothetical protein
VGVDFLKEIFYLNHSLISFALIELPNHPTSSCSNPFESATRIVGRTTALPFLPHWSLPLPDGEYRELVEADWHHISTTVNCNGFEVEFFLAVSLPGYFLRRSLGVNGL